MRQERRYWLPLAVAIIVLLIWVAGFLLPLSVFKSWNDRAAFGEVFGATNALFAGLAFAGLIYAILLQREELSLQRNELELTRDQLQRAADAQEKSQRALAEQVEMQLLAIRIEAVAALLNHRAATAGKNVYADAVLTSSGHDAESYATQLEGLLKHMSTFKGQ